MRLRHSLCEFLDKCFVLLNWKIKQVGQFIIDRGHISITKIIKQQFELIHFKEASTSELGELTNGPVFSLIHIFIYNLLFRAFDLDYSYEQSRREY